MTYVLLFLSKSCYSDYEALFGDGSYKMGVVVRGLLSYFPSTSCSLLNSHWQTSSYYRDTISSSFISSKTSFTTVLPAEKLFLILASDELS
jgi:hypothetical protein